MAGNYPPGVTGNEPQIVGYPDDYADDMPSEKQLENWREANEYTNEAPDDDEDEQHNSDLASRNRSTDAWYSRIDDEDEQRDELPPATPETDGLTAGGLYLDMTAAWHALTLAEWQGRPDRELLAHYDAYLTALGAYVKFRREWQDRQGQREAERVRQREAERVRRYAKRLARAVYPEG